MVARVIPLVPQRSTQLALPSLQPQALAPTGWLQDSRGRPLHDLRISVTDRCNFRCNYCMPKEVFDKNHAYLPHSALLSFEEITRLARLFMAHGVRKIRLTGGEPLLRRNLERLHAHGSIIAYANDMQHDTLAQLGLQCLFRDPARNISLWRFAP